MAVCGLMFNGTPGGVYFEKLYPEWKSINPEKLIDKMIWNEIEGAAVYKDVVLPLTGNNMAYMKDENNVLSARTAYYTPATDAVQCYGWVTSLPVIFDDFVSISAKFSEIYRNSSTAKAGVYFGISSSMPLMPYGYIKTIDGGLLPGGSGTKAVTSPEFPGKDDFDTLDKHTFGFPIDTVSSGDIPRLISENSYVLGTIHTGSTTANTARTLTLDTTNIVGPHYVSVIAWSCSTNIYSRFKITEVTLKKAGS